jgi:hypothetical protein
MVPIVDAATDAIWPVMRSSATRPSSGVVTSIVACSAVPPPSEIAWPEEVAAAENSAGIVMTAW